MAPWIWTLQKPIAIHPKYIHRLGAYKLPRQKAYLQLIQSRLHKLNLHKRPLPQTQPDKTLLRARSLAIKALAPRLLRRRWPPPSSRCTIEQWLGTGSCGDSVVPDSSKPIVIHALGWSSTRNRRGVTVKNVVGSGEDIVLDLRNHGSFHMRVNVYYHGGLLMVARFTIWMLCGLRVEKPEWEVRIPKGMDLSLLDCCLYSTFMFAFGFVSLCVLSMVGVAEICFDIPTAMITVLLAEILPIDFPPRSYPPSPSELERRNERRKKMWTPKQPRCCRFSCHNPCCSTVPSPEIVSKVNEKPKIAWIGSHRPNPLPHALANWRLIATSTRCRRDVCARISSALGRLMGLCYQHSLASFQLMGMFLMLIGLLVRSKFKVLQLWMDWELHFL
ncbi:hypothetical protein BDV34DRAFT_191738 [Aspergillus parasiticus]|uniref:Uncharacterized protein n=1 Tax=Aspergillus parasiticus TaxID=5067 RepID=A0A5N6DRF0_ASPPA|nr:hypothetical protein BDV34DRAFT_191738 [Aspergillus parasiticus]